MEFLKNTLLQSTVQLCIKIHIFPLRTISSSAIVFKKNTVYLLFTFVSGYQMRLNFINLTSEDKKELRMVFTELNTILCK